MGTTIKSLQGCAGEFDKASPVVQDSEVGQLIDAVGYLQTVFGDYNSGVEIDEETAVNVTQIISWQKEREGQQTIINGIGARNSGLVPVYYDDNVSNGKGLSLEVRTHRDSAEELFRFMGIDCEFEEFGEFVGKCKQRSVSSWGVATSGDFPENISQRGQDNGLEFI